MNKNLTHDNLLSWLLMYSYSYISTICVVSFSFIIWKKIHVFRILVILQGHIQSDE